MRRYVVMQKLQILCVGAAGSKMLIVHVCHLTIIHNNYNVPKICGAPKNIWIESSDQVHP